MLKICSIVCAACCVLFLTLFFIHQKVLPNVMLLKAEEISPWSSPSTEEEIAKVKQILQKPLKFFGHGSQCFAFLSEDGNYAVKICRSSRYRFFFSSEGKEKKERDFLSYFLAFHSLPEQSQVVFIHLNKTQNLNTTFEVIDPLGFSHFLKADNLAFYIQKKAIPLPEYLTNLSTSESKVLAKKLLNLFKSCCQEGLQILDIYAKNIGVYNGEPLWIDPGRIRKKPSLREEGSQKKALYRFKSLLDPSLEPLHSEFSQFLEEELKTSF